MTIKTVLFAILFMVFLNVETYSQTESELTRSKFLGIDAGINSFTGETQNLDKIRANISYFDSNANSLESQMIQTSTGIKYEMRSLNNLFGLSLGLRYTNIASSTLEGSMSTSSFFYFLINNQGTTTEYLRVNKIEQRSNYIGVPIEFSFFPNIPGTLKPYAKLGFQYAYAVSNKLKVSFYDSAMDLRKEELASQLVTPKAYFLAVNTALGIEIGKENKPALCLELCVPAFFITNEVSSLMKPYAGFGFQFNLLIPTNILSNEK